MMPTAKIAAASALASLLLAAPAAAEPVALPFGTLEIALPDGYCALDPNDPIEAEVIAFVVSMQEGQNVVVSQFVECAELALWRAGTAEEFFRFGQVMLPLSDGQVLPLPFDRATFLQEMVGYLPAVDDAMVKEVVEQINDNSQGIGVEDVQFLGLMDRDEAGIYVGMLSRPTFEGEGSGFQAGLMSMTLIQRVVVSTYLYRVYEDEEDFDRLIVEQKAYLADLIAANP